MENYNDHIDLSLSAIRDALKSLNKNKIDSIVERVNISDEAQSPASLAGAVMCRYSLFERRDLNSRILWNGTNKSELKKVRTGWKYQIMLTRVTAEIYDNVKKEWVA